MSKSRRNQDKIAEGQSLAVLMQNVNRAEFAREYGIDASMIGQNIKGIRPISLPYAIAYSKGLGVPMEEISPFWANANKETAELSADTSATSDFIQIPQYNTGGKMGNGLVLRDQPGIIKSWNVSPEWLRLNVPSCTSPNNLAIVTGFGDSMRGMFNPGDPLIVDTGVKTVEIDAVFFFRVGKEGYIKRLQRIPTVDGTILRAISENKAYDPFDIVEGMDFEVFGRVLKAWESTDY